MDTKNITERGKLGLEINIINTAQCWQDKSVASEIFV